MMFRQGAAEYNRFAPCLFDKKKYNKTPKEIFYFKKIKVSAINNSYKITVVKNNGIVYRLLTDSNNVVIE